MGTGEVIGHGSRARYPGIYFLSRWCADGCTAFYSLEQRRRATPDLFRSNARRPGRKPVSMCASFGKQPWESVLGQTRLHRCTRSASTKFCVVGISQQMTSVRRSCRGREVRPPIPGMTPRSASIRVNLVRVGNPGPETIEKMARFDFLNLI
jgi:hypothetical protein